MNRGRRDIWPYAPAEQSMGGIRERPERIRSQSSDEYDSVRLAPFSRIQPTGRKVRSCLSFIAL